MFTCLLFLVVSTNTWKIIGKNAQIFFLYFLQNQKDSSIKKTYLWDKICFQLVKKKRKIQTPLKMMIIGQLDNSLHRCYAEARTKMGDKYSKSSLPPRIEWYLNEPQFNKGIKNLFWSKVQNIKPDGREDCKLKEKPKTNHSSQADNQQTRSNQVEKWHYIRSNYSFVFSCFDKTTSPM